MDTAVIVISVLFAITLGLGIFCFTEPRGKNTKHARREIEEQEARASYKGFASVGAKHSHANEMALDEHSQEAA